MPVLDHERMAMVAGAASLGASGAALKLPGIVEPRDDLVFDVRGVRAVVAPKLPGRGVERAALHELRETRRAPIRGYTVVQFPNPPLWVALAALRVAWLTDDGSVIDDLARAISYVALTVWAYEEAANGVNGFRKALGIGALVLIVVAIARGVG